MRPDDGLDFEHQSDEEDSDEASTDEADDFQVIPPFIQVLPSLSM